MPYPESPKVTSIPLALDIEDDCQQRVKDLQAPTLAAPLQLY